MMRKELTEQEILTGVMTAVAERTARCDRGILAMRNDGAQAVALVGPNCLMLATVISQEPPLIFDAVMN